MNIAVLYSKVWGHLIGVVDMEEESIILKAPARISQHDDSINLEPVILWCDFDKLKIDKSNISFMSYSVTDWMIDLFTKYYQDLYEIPNGVTLH